MNRALLIGAGLAGGSLLLLLALGSPARASEEGVNAALLRFHLELGREALERGAYRTAHTHYRKALEIDGRCEEALEGLVEAGKERNHRWEWLLRILLPLALAIVSIVFGIRAHRRKKRRMQVAREAQAFFAREAPGALLAECPSCRIPFPAESKKCPFCCKTRRRARLDRRDHDWNRETRPRN